MTIESHWDNESRSIAVMAIDGSWTWKEYGDAVDDLKQLMDEVDHPVDLIIDLSQSRPLPERALDNLRRSIKTPHDNWTGIAVIVGAGAFVEAIMGVVTRVWARGDQRYLFASTREKAYEILKEQGGVDHNDLSMQAG